MAARAFICQQQPEGTEDPLHLLQDKDQAPFLALEALPRLLPGSLSPPPSILQTYLPAPNRARPLLPWSLCTGCFFCPLPGTPAGPGAERRMQSPSSLCFQSPVVYLWHTPALGTHICPRWPLGPPWPRPRACTQYRRPRADALLTSFIKNAV